MFAKTYPDKRLGTYEYATYRDLPFGVRPHPNLLVGFVGWATGITNNSKPTAAAGSRAGAAKNLFLRAAAFHHGHA